MSAIFLPQASPSSQQFTGRTCSTKSKVKKQTNSINKPHNHVPQRSSAMQKSTQLNSIPPAQFGLMGYTSIHTQAMAAFHHLSIPSQPQAPLEISNSMITNSSTNVSFPNQTPYQHHHHMLSPQPTNPFMPAVMYWPPQNTYPPTAPPYAPPTYGYQSLPSAGNYIPINPQPYYTTPMIPKIAEGDRKIEMALKEDGSDSDSSSSRTEPKKD